MKTQNILALLGCLMLMVLIHLPANTSAAQEDRVDRLGKRISDLEKRIDTLERIVLTNTATKKTTKYPPAGKEDWRRLKTGMTEEQVKSILGEPLKVQGGIVAKWYYSEDLYSAYVGFIYGSLTAWEEP
jgi:hypothetical protein